RPVIMGRAGVVRTDMRKTIALLSVIAFIGADTGCGRGSAVSGSSQPVSPNEGTFLIAHDPPVVRDRERPTPTVLAGGDVLIAGGESGTLGGPAGTAERYHPVSQSFAATATLLTARARHTATRLLGDAIFIVGGEGAGGTLLDSGEIFDQNGGTNGSFSA